MFSILSVEDCYHHHYEGWWDVISQCFKQKVERNPQDWSHLPSICQPAPSGEYQESIHQIVDELNKTVSEDSSISFPNVQTDVPEDYRPELQIIHLSICVYIYYKS